MIDPVKVIQTKAFARQDGVILAAVWIVAFLFAMKSVSAPLLGSLSNVLTLCTPVIVAMRLRSFREDVTCGVISYRRALFYCVMTFFYATLLLTVVQFVWFKWFDGGSFASTQVIPTYKMMFEVYKIPDSEAKVILDTVTYLKPAAWASFFMMTEMILGTIVSFPIAAVMKREVPK